MLRLKLVMRLDMTLDHSTMYTGLQSGGARVLYLVCSSQGGEGFPAIARGAFTNASLQSQIVFLKVNLLQIMCVQAFCKNDGI